MASMGQHETSQGKDRLLWAAVLIAACAMLEVWASWLQVGSVAGFPHFGRMTTGWVLPVSTEAYWSCALVAWLGGAAGSRSRRFAMWSAIGMFALSLAGQEFAHLLAADRAAPSPWVVGFVSALPLVSLGLIAVLVHLRHADRAEAATAARAEAEAKAKAAALRAEDDERTVLRAEVTALEEELAAVTRTAETQQAEARRVLQAAVSDMEEQLATARSEAEKAASRAESLTRKLASATGHGKGAPGSRKAGSQSRKTAPVAPEAHPVSPDDLPGNWDALDTEARVLFLVNEKGYSGSKAGLAAGVTDARGRQIVRMARDLGVTAPQDVVGSAADPEA